MDGIRQVRVASCDSRFPMPGRAGLWAVGQRIWGAEFGLWAVRVAQSC